MANGDISIRDSVCQFSRLVDNSLDCLGYEKEQVLRRSEFNTCQYGKISEFARRVIGVNVQLFVAGSKLEGVPLGGSDTDLQMVLRDVICVEEGRGEDGVTVLETDMKHCPPGYTKLHVVRFHGTPIDRVLEDCTAYSFRNDTNEFYISSLSITNALCSNFCLVAIPIHEDVTYTNPSSNGPALSLTIKLSSPFLSNPMAYDLDLVPALPVYFNSALANWSSRRRYHDWPPRDVINDVIHTEGCLVPTSFKESMDSHLEWRLCFPQGERYLVHSLNEWQIKVYVLLKMVNKEVIRKKSDGLTSYMMKNVIFWVCEGIPSALFRPEWLVDRLKNALYFIQYCVINNFLPCYLIPERNLLLGKLEGHRKYLVLNILSELVNSNGGFLYDCDRLCDGIVLSYSHPSVALNVKVMRNQLANLSMTFTIKAVSEDQDWMLDKNVMSRLYDKLIKDPHYMSYVLSLTNFLGIEFIFEMLNPMYAERFTKTMQQLLLI